MTTCKLADVARRIESVIDQMQRVRLLQSVEERRRILTLRKDLAAALAMLQPAHYAEREAGADAEFDRRLSDLRRVIAIHQAAWPAVLLDEAPQEYLASADLVRREIRAMLDWLWASRA